MSANGFNPEALAYFVSHAIEPDVAAEVGVRQVGNSLHYPYSDNGTDYERRRSLSSAKTFQPEAQRLAVWWPQGKPDKASAVLVCEGEGDALAALSAMPEAARSIMTVAAIPGTPLPPDRLAQELRSVGATKAFLAFDADEAGSKCTDRAAIALLAAKVEPIVVELPEGRDLADCLASEENGPAWLANALADAEAASIYTSPEADTPPEGADLPDKADWPALDSRALHGVAGDIVRVIAPHSESDPAALLLQILAAAGNAMGRHSGIGVEADVHVPNLYVLLVGETAKSRKGTSWGQASRPVRDADAPWSENRVQGGLSSGEGLIWAVRDPVVKTVAVKDEKRKPTGEYEEQVEDAGIDDKRLMVFEAEFASTLRVLGRDGNTLSPVIRQGWDTGTLRTMTKNSPAVATGAHISIVGHITREELRRFLTATEAGNGFANRFLFACVKRSKALPDGGRVPESELSPLVDEITTAIRFATVSREVGRDAEASALWREVYKPLSEGRPGLLGAVTSRGEAQVLRLSLIYALLDQSPQIRIEHLKAALALWDYCDASCRFIFEDTTGSPKADTILGALRRSPEGLSRTEIHNLFGRHAREGEIDHALGVLLSGGLARATKEGTAGRPVERWLACERSERSDERSGARGLIPLNSLTSHGAMG